MQIQKVSSGLLLTTSLWVWGVVEGIAVHSGAPQGVDYAKSLHALALHEEVLEERLAKMESRFAEASKDKPKANEEMKKQEKTREGGSSSITQHAAAVKYPAIAWLSDSIEMVFGKLTDVRWKDWKLWIGIVAWSSVWGIWLRRGFQDTFLIRFVFTFGINILILHFLQYEHDTHLALRIIYVLLGAHGMFQSWFLWMTKADEKLKMYDCDTMYMDLSLPGYQILVLFLGQICLWWFYMTSIIANTGIQSINYLFWILTFLVMQITMIFNRGDDSVLGNAFPVSQWLYMVRRTDTLAFKQREDEAHRSMSGTSIQLSHTDSMSFKDLDTKKPFRVDKATLIMRGVFGFFVNTILREILAYTIPLMMMEFHEPMQFVVYCCGVNFICTVDDMRSKMFEVQEIGDIEQWRDLV